MSLILLFGVAAGVVLGVLNNYLHEVLSISKVERGAVELFRELPGLLLVILISLLYRICEVRILRLAFLVSILGVVGLSLMGHIRWFAVLMIVLWSTGEHIFMPIRQSIAVHMAHRGKEGLALGASRSMRNTGQVIGFYLIPLLFLVIPFRDIVRQFQVSFVLAGTVLVIGFLISFRLRRDDRHIQRKRLYLRKKYTKYYVLELLFGARKQVFLTFAPYVLVVSYGIETQMMALLYGIYSTVNIFVAPLIGRFIDRWGYRIVIIVDTVLLVGLCLMYGFSHRLFSPTTATYVVCFVFILDGVLFVAGIARTVYAKTISTSQDELTSTLSTGISINHLVSIAIAIVGGLIWQGLGVEALFLVAAAFGLGSFGFALTLPREAS